MKLVISFKLSTVHKKLVAYEEVVVPNEKSKVGRIYVRQDAIGQPFPETVTVTIEG